MRQKNLQPMYGERVQYYNSSIGGQEVTEKQELVRVGFQ